MILTTISLELQILLSNTALLPPVLLLRAVYRHGQREKKKKAVLCTDGTYGRFYDMGGFVWGLKCGLGELIKESPICPGQTQVPKVAIILSTPRELLSHNPSCYITVGLKSLPHSYYTNRYHHPYLLTSPYEKRRVQNWG